MRSEPPADEPTLHCGSTVEVLAEANRLGGTDYRLTLLAVGKDTVISSTGMAVKVGGDLRGADVDTLLVAGGDRLVGKPIEPDSIWVQDDPVFTSDGVSAGIDLALALAERDAGGEPARTIRRLGWPPGNERLNRG
jgi:transcriptional regulator GlxA family with amidase domain